MGVTWRIVALSCSDTTSTICGFICDKFEFCVVYCHLVPVRTFGVMYDHILYYARKSPDQISRHTKSRLSAW